MLSSHLSKTFSLSPSSKPASAHVFLIFSHVFLSSLSKTSLSWFSLKRKQTGSPILFSCFNRSQKVFKFAFSPSSLYNQSSVFFKLSRKIILEFSSMKLE
eukprot:Lithocolla_globosa_v1_NODE_7731_length_907_cov_10.987089.p2 type:complete len:100 gc:universal NODE_7731_length_907_cov_10.987089:669-370(-)